MFERGRGGTRSTCPRGLKADHSAGEFQFLQRADRPRHNRSAAGRARERFSRTRGGKPCNYWLRRLSPPKSLLKYAAHRVGLWMRCPRRSGACENPPWGPYALSLRSNRSCPVGILGATICDAHLVAVSSLTSTPITSPDPALKVSILIPSSRYRMLNSGLCNWRI
jgi:hypothetical protein